MMGKIRELDGLRASAILMVVAWHYLGSYEPPHSWQWRAFVVGRSGVDLFFVLSGYLITGILLRSRKSPNYFSAFYGRRALRILPIYAGMVFVYLIGRHLSGSDTAQYLFGGAIPWWSYIFGLQNLWMASEQTYGAVWLAGTWSLAIEEQFYLFFPLFLYFAPARVVPWLLIALLVLCPVGRLVAYCMGDEMGYYVLTPLRADILAVGGLIAWLQFQKVTLPSVRRVFVVVFWAAVLFFPAFAWLIENSTFNNAVWGHTYLTAFYGSLLFMIVDRQGVRQLAFLRNGIAAFFARISYALYLVHIPVLILTVWAARNYSVPSPLLPIIAFGISVTICLASYHWIEGPLIKIGHRRFAYQSNLQQPVNLDDAAGDLTRTVSSVNQPST
jgi:peptidoglycan/LPS O-acetylase OafA/YrhL